jgi:hypothetical protein
MSLSKWKYFGATKFLLKLAFYSKITKENSFFFNLLILNAAPFSVIISCRFVRPSGSHASNKSKIIYLDFFFVAAS